MLAKTIRRFYDKQAKRMREAGDEFEVTESRFAEINSTKHGVLVEEVKNEPKPDPVPEVKNEPKPEDPPEAKVEPKKAAKK